MDEADAAEVWLRRAAMQEHANAALALGLLLSDKEMGSSGEGLHWVERAADMGSITATGLLSAV